MGTAVRVEVSSSAAAVQGSGWGVRLNGLGAPSAGRSEAEMESSQVGEGVNVIRGGHKNTDRHKGGGY